MEEEGKESENKERDGRKNHRYTTDRSKGGFKVPVDKKSEDG
jgi:hypothetical protein